MVLMIMHLSCALACGQLLVAMEVDLDIEYHKQNLMTRHHLPCCAIIDNTLLLHRVCDHLCQLFSIKW